MEIINIFAKNLFAIKYEDEDCDELERLFDLWNDKEYLEDFFEINKSDLSYYKITVEQAIEETVEEINAIEDIILSEDISELLQSFTNLNNSESRVYELIKQKSRRRWLRLYAIRIDYNVFIISGGAIKLTSLMKDREHTQQELYKLDKCENFLKENGIFDNDSFNDMLNEEL